MARLYYLSHPQVVIDPNVAITDWGLNDVGRARIAALAARAADVFSGTVAVFSSPERKARDAAEPLAHALNLPVQIAADSYENDRSATGFLPPPAFELAADAFFAQPDVSYRGWERASDAQRRITGAVARMMRDSPEGNLLVVGHGAVGTLLFCALSGIPISRDHDQGSGGGGNLMVFDRKTGAPLQKWQPIEALSEKYAGPPKAD